MRQLKITSSITNRDGSTIEKYFTEVSREPMVTAEEEVILAQRIRQGDHAALERLVKANLRFVVSVAKQYQHGKIPLNDLINEGNLGLIKAAKMFDETRGFKFISYAVWWIRQSIMQALAEHSRLVRIPVNKVAELSKIKNAASFIEQRSQREASPDELAEYLQITVDDIRNIQVA
ncbi:MAG TPA: sigma-70 family RNA polymerase sigma factor, partial [Cytophagaceae bacterium]